MSLTSRGTGIPTGTTDEAAEDNDDREEIECGEAVAGRVGIGARIGVNE